ncbi:hypothetical protein [Streptomyces sp. NPDC057689]|uniref:hypothetical protein n=1 Tax=Streptomyces sp. NPDC057689 TaxID=3346213 RepID=UPI0036B5165B
MSRLAVAFEGITAVCAARVLVRQLRGLLMDISDAIHAWRSVRDAVRGRQDEQAGCPLAT